MEWEYNEEILIDRAQNENDEALSHLIHHHYNFVFNYLQKMTLDTSLAEDLTQDTFYKVVQKIKLFNKDKASFSTWLIQIAINTSKDYYRKQKTKISFLDKLKKDTDETSTPILGLGMTSMELPNDEMLDLKEVLTRLKPEQRIPLVLKYYYGYEQKEIAELMGIPTGTVKSRLSYGLKFIRKELEYEKR